VPASLGSPARSAPSARLRGPARCVHGLFRARVTGHGIAQVSYYVDGRLRRTIKAKAGQTVFALLTVPRARSFAIHRITAKVRFARAGTKTRTLRMVYQRCSRATATPQFAG
jgi:hypothetical protein